MWRDTGEDNQAEAGGLEQILPSQLSENKLLLFIPLSLWHFVRIGIVNQNEILNE